MYLSHVLGKEICSSFGRLTATFFTWVAPSKVTPSIVLRAIPMSSLIVDFPERRTSSADTQAEAKRVRFSPTARIQYFQGSEKSDSSRLYYSEDEYQEMKAARWRAIRNLHRRYLAMSSGERPIQDLEFTGLENFLNREIAQRMTNRRKALLRDVLLEQARQGGLGECDPTEIARVARHHSQSSVKRAEKIASFTLSQVKDGRDERSM